MHRAQTAKDINTISFAYDSPMSPLDRVKIWLTSVYSSSPSQSEPTPVDLSVEDSLWQMGAF